jgi:hypothetical protein
MEEYENIYDKIKELLGSLPGKLNVLEEKIDIDLQLEYFEQSRRERRTALNPEKVLEDSYQLFNFDVSEEDKKCILARIASIAKVEAYRIIERFLNEVPPDLKNWTILALQENRMLLESMLLDESHVFISTGLGGKGNKLRYFVVIFGKETNDFNDFQKRIIQSEFMSCLKKYNSEIEELNFSGSIANMMVIIPMKVIIKKIFTEAIKECNQFGDFLISNFIITNVKELSFDEVREYVKKKQLFQDRKSNNEK